MKPRTLSELRKSYPNTYTRFLESDLMSDFEKIADKLPEEEKQETLLHLAFIFGMRLKQEEAQAQIEMVRRDQALVHRARTSEGEAHLITKMKLDKANALINELKKQSKANEKIINNFDKGANDENKQQQTTQIWEVCK